jgi:hypothetical protein
VDSVSAGQLVWWRPEGRKRDPILAKVVHPSATGKRVKIECEHPSTRGLYKWWTYVTLANLEPRA